MLESRQLINCISSTTVKLYLPSVIAGYHTIPHSATMNLPIVLIPNCTEGSFRPEEVLTRDG